MNTNCLVTKLKGTVNNDSLRYYGEFKLLGNEITLGNNGFVRVLGLNGCTVIIEDGQAYSDEQRTISLGNKFKVTSDNFYFVLSNGNPVVRFADGAVYKCTRVAAGTKINFDVSDLLYAKQGVILGVYGNPISGNIDNLAERADGSIVIQKLDSAVADISAYGNIANLSKFDFDANGQSGYLGFDLNDSALVGNISAFASSAFNHLKEQMTRISTGSNNVGKIFGDVESFKDYTNMVFFDLSYIELTGNLATALGEMTKLSFIAVAGHSAAEDLKNLFDALHANGKTSGSIQIWAGSNKTVNGTPWVNGNTVTFSASGWSVNS
jgi:hypothetical protein